jgi:hypothetical protein
MEAGPYNPESKRLQPLLHHGLLRLVFSAAGIIGLAVSPDFPLTTSIDCCSSRSRVLSSDILLPLDKAASPP